MAIHLETFMVVDSVRPQKCGDFVQELPHALKIWIEICRFKSLHFTPSRLEFSSSNLGAVSDKHVENFRPAICHMENPTKQGTMLIHCQGFRDVGQRRSIHVV
jgi:hypothetical protein